MTMPLRRILFGLLLGASTAVAGALPEELGEALGLADSAALRATVFGAAPDDLAAMPSRVPTKEINIDIEGSLPVPDVFWFNRKLRAYWSKQRGPAPLAIVISGTGGDANTQKIRILRRALYGAGHHVLTLPSPTYPRFIVAASSTGVTGDLRQDGEDLHRAITQLVARLRKDNVPITEINVLGYSLGGANAGMVKSIDDERGEIGIKRAVLVNPPVNLFNSIARLDRLLEVSVGTSEADFDRLYHEIYSQLSTHYTVSDTLDVDQDFLLDAAGAVLASDKDLAAGISLSFRLSLIDMFFAGDLYAGTGVVLDPNDPPGPGDSLNEVFRTLRRKSFSDYFEQVFVPYYTARRPGSTPETLIASNHLRIIEQALRNDPDYYAQTNSDELILNQEELDWLRDTFGERIAIYDHGGHLGNLGEHEQIQDLLDMLSGTYRSAAP